MKPKASFVIPVHNGAAWLAETVMACLRQTLRSIEVIIVDDGSTDTTYLTANHYVRLDPRVRFHRLQQNMGRSIARNEGAKLAQSDIILVNDSDDVSDYARAMETVRYFKKNPDIDIAYSSFWVIDQNGELGGEVPAKPFDFDRMRTHPRLFFEVGHSSMAFRKRVAQKVPYTDGEYSQHAIDDWKFMVDAHKAGFKFGVIQKPLMYYRLIPKVRNEQKIMDLKRAALQ